MLSEWHDFQMQGLGYLHPRWRHGTDHGGDVAGTDSWKLAEIDPTAPENIHAQQICRATRADGAVGLGLFEHLAIGPHIPSGLPDGIAPPADMDDDHRPGGRRAAGASRAADARARTGQRAGSGLVRPTVASIAVGNTPTLIWARDARYFGEQRLSAEVRATADLAEAVVRADVLVVGVPDRPTPSVQCSARPRARSAPGCPCSPSPRGSRREPGCARRRPSASVCPGHPIGLLAGPNIAREIEATRPGYEIDAGRRGRRGHAAAVHQQPVRGLPQYRHAGLRARRRAREHIAIASGMADGLGVSANTRSRVLTRGLAEMMRFGAVMGANPRTFAGLTSLGDLFTTAMSPPSRKSPSGEAMARGLSLDEAIAALGGQVADGAAIPLTVMQIAEQRRVQLPFCCVS